MRVSPTAAGARGGQDCVVRWVVLVQGLHTAVRSQPGEKSREFKHAVLLFVECACF